MIHVELTLAFTAAIYFTFLWLAPYALAEGRTPATGLPGYLVEIAASRGIDVYFVDGRLEGIGYACACFLGRRRAVLINRTFARLAPQAAVTFTFAHELGHHKLRHPELRWILTALCLHQLGPVRRLLERTEEAANRWAETVTRLPRAVVWGVAVKKPSVAGGSGYSTEENER